MRHEKFTMVLNGPEKVAMERLAALEGGLSRAEIVRRLLRDHARQCGVWPVDEQPQKQEALDHVG